MKKIYIESLGCPKNLVDSEYILAVLKKKNYKIADTFHNADIIIINTCGFIDQAKEESIHYILNYSKLQDKELIVTGCLVNLNKKKLLKDIPEIKHFYSIKEFFKKYLNVKYNKDIDYSDFERLSPVSYSYVKISDGCNKKCSFCIIPLIKGKQFSRKIDNILKEIRKKLDHGINEFNLVAQDLINFGKDNKESLSMLINRIEEINFDFKVRLLYLYPDDSIIDLVKQIKDSEKIINYLDIPVQHSSEKILKLMRRPYKKDFYLNMFDKIRNIGDFILRSTFIIGFPGEDDNDFKNLTLFLNKIKFNWAGFYSYSDEEAACSSKLNNKIDNDIIIKRIEDVTEIQKNITSKWLNTRLNKEYTAVVDEIVKHDDYILLRSDHEAPDIDGNIIIKYKDNIKVGDYIRVKIKDVFEFDMEGEVL